VETAFRLASSSKDMPKMQRELQRSLEFLSVVRNQIAEAKVRAVSRR